MLRKLRILMAQLHRTTQQDISAPSSSVLPLEPSWPTGAVIGGRHTVTRVITIPTPPHTVALTMATVITTARRITTTTPEPMAGMGVLTVRMDPRIGEPVTILTRAHTLEVVRYPLLTAAEARPKPIIPTPALMRRRDKAPAPQLNGAARMCLAETRALPRAITPLPMEP